MTPSILVDLVLRDLTATQVDAAAANIRAKLSGIQVPLAVSPQATQQLQSSAQAAQKLSTAAAQAQKNLRIPKEALSDAEKYEEAVRKQVEAIRFRERVNKDVYARLTAQERDAMGKRLGRSPYTIEHPFESLFTKQGVTDRFKSLIAGQVGTLLVYGTTIGAVTAATRGFVSANNELEDALARVRTVLEGTRSQQQGQYERLRVQAIAWGKAHAQSAKDAADAMYNLISAGQSVEETQKNLPAVLNLIYGGFLEAGFGAETAATAYELFAKKGLTMVDIVDRIQKTANVSQLTVEQYAQSFNFVASTVDLANISFDELNATLATVADFGLRGSKAGRNLAEALAQLLAKQDKLREFGIEVAGADGNLRSLGEIYQQFREKVGSKLDTQELKILRDVFGAEGLRPIGLVLENMERYERHLKDMAKAEGQALDASLKRGATLSQMWDQLTNKVKAYAQETGGLTKAFEFTLKQVDVNLRADQFADLFAGTQGSVGVRSAIQRMGDVTVRDLSDIFRKLPEKMQQGLRDTGAGEGLFTEAVRRALTEPDEEAGRLLRGALGDYFETIAKELEAGEMQDRLRGLMGDRLHISPRDLIVFDFSQEDVAAVEADARGWVQRALDAVTRAWVEGAGKLPTDQVIKLGTQFGILQKLLATMLDDKQWRASLTDKSGGADKLSDLLNKIATDLERARIEFLKSIRTTDIKVRLEIIDEELLAQQRKNKLEYEKVLHDLAELLPKTDARFKKAAEQLKKTLELKDVADFNRASAQRQRVYLEERFGIKEFEKLERTVRQSMLGLARSFESPDLRRRMQIIDEELLAAQDRNVETFTQRVLALPDTILASGEETERAIAKLKEALRLDNLAERNKAFYEKDRVLRDALIADYDRQAAQAQRLQMLLLQQGGAGPVRQIIEQNRQVRRELEEFLRIPVAGQPLDFTKDIRAQLEAVFAQGEAKLQLLEALQTLTPAAVRPEDVERLSDAIDTLGFSAGLTADDVAKLQQLLGDLQLTADPLISIVDSLDEAMGSVSDAMQELGDEPTWRKIGRGVDVVASAIKRVDLAIDKLGAEDALSKIQGSLGIVSAVFSLAGFIGSLFDTMEERQRNIIGTEDYKYAPGRNVSPDYGRAQTINVQVDMNPNFNFLEPSQLGPPTQRRIAFELGDDFVEYLQTNGWLPRR